MKKKRKKKRKITEYEKILWSAKILQSAWDFIVCARP